MCEQKKEEKSSVVQCICFIILNLEISHFPWIPEGMFPSSQPNLKLLGPLPPLPLALAYTDPGSVWPRCRAWRMKLQRSHQVQEQKARELQLEVALLCLWLLSCSHCIAHCLHCTLSGVQERTSFMCTDNGLLSFLSVLHNHLLDFSFLSWPWNHHLVPA